MKFKYIIFALLVPLSAFADRTNLFDSIKLNNTLDVTGRSIFRQPILINHSNAVSSVVVTNMLASPALFYAARNDGGRILEGKRLDDGGVAYLTFFGGYASLGTAAATPKSIGLFVSDGNPTLQIYPNGNLVIANGDASTTTFTNAQATVRNAGTAGNNVLDLVGLAGQTGDMLRIRTSAGATLARFDSNAVLSVSNYISQYSINYENTAGVPTRVNGKIASLSMIGVVAGGSGNITYTYTNANGTPFFTSLIGGPSCTAHRNSSTAVNSPNASVVSYSTSNCVVKLVDGQTLGVGGGDTFGFAPNGTTNFLEVTGIIP